MKVGDTIAGRYELLESLGGGRGALFVAQDRTTNRRVAVKIFAAAAPEDLQRYAARLVAADRVRHTSVVLPRIQVATSESPPFIAGELLQGEDLAGLCGHTQPLPWPRALAIVQACCEGLGALAEATGAAHLALRPGNVWNSGDWPAQVLDFGISELGPPPSRPRADGSFVEYRAPEQLEGSPGDARSDVFSLGVLLLEAVTGVHPFASPNAAAVNIKVLMQPVPTPAQLAPQVELPAALTPLLARMLARRPKDRIADAASLGRELATLLAAAPRVAARPVITPPTPPPEPEPEVDRLPAPPPAEVDAFAGLHKLSTFAEPPRSPATAKPPARQVELDPLPEPDEITEAAPARPASPRRASPPPRPPARPQPPHEDTEIVARPGAPATVRKKRSVSAPVHMKMVPSHVDPDDEITAGSTVRESRRALADEVPERTVILPAPERPEPSYDALYHDGETVVARPPVAAQRGEATEILQAVSEDDAPTRTRLPVDPEYETGQSLVSQISMVRPPPTAEPEPEHEEAEHSLSAPVPDRGHHQRMRVFMAVNLLFGVLLLAGIAWLLLRG